MDQCNRCQSTVDAEATIKLWDGKSYCVDCVASVCPSLLDHARNNDQLMEVLPSTPLSIVENSKILAQLVLFLGVLFIAVLLVIGADLSSLELFFLSLFLNSVVLLLVMPLLIFIARKVESQLPRTITVHDGLVTIKYRSFEVSHRLTDVDAFFATSKWDRDTISLPTRVVIVLSILPDRSTQVACGLNDEMREIWHGFLQLAGIGVRPRYPTMQLLVGGFLGLAVGAIIGYVLGGLFLERNMDARWMPTLRLLGAMDGAAIGLLLVSAWYTSGCRKTQPQPKHIMIGFFVFGCFATGLKGGQFGIIIMIISGICNGVLGYAIARILNRTIRKEVVSHHDGNSIDSKKS